MKDTVFDVVIPAYNASRFLAETLDAITRQNLLPNKVFVVDDGSTDDTAQIAARYDPLVTLSFFHSAPMATSTTAECKMPRKVGSANT